MTIILTDEQQRHIERMAGSTLFTQGYIRRLIDDDIRRKNLKVVADCERPKHKRDTSKYTGDKSL